MEPGSSTVDAGSPASRVGFWLGLLLFVLLLLVPPPQSMQRVAVEYLRPQVEADTAQILRRCGQAEVPRDSALYQQAWAAAAQNRARIMLGAGAVTALVACWWITVAAPIPVTSLLPLVLLPMVGVAPVRRLAAAYADPNVFLFLGGFIIALAIERWGLHRRIALHVVLLVGTGRRAIVLGFMLAAALVSMWISNTATTMMMLPIGMAVCAALGELSTDTGRDRVNFDAAVMLGIAYGASIGGIGTPIGTPPNIVFLGIYRNTFPAAPELGFAQWVALFAPLSLVFVIAAWLVLVGLVSRFESGGVSGGRDLVRKHLRELGPLRGPEAAVLAVFVGTAVLWITRSIPVGVQTNYGWAPLLEDVLRNAWGLSGFRADYIDDATVALGMATLLFVMPAGRDGVGRRRYLMDWQTAQKLPWGVLLLFGGGFAIAAAVHESGLSHWCGEVFGGLVGCNPWLLVAGTCLVLTFLTEITSNTATAQVMLPILAQVSRSAGLNPLLLMLPATVSASCAFMLPVATPPNAIVFGTGRVQMRQMVRAGLVLNFVGVVLVTLFMRLFVARVLGVDAEALPGWAR